MRGQRAAKGEERAGGGWRLFISGCTAAEAGTRVRRVGREEESGGRSQHAQPGDGGGEWLRPDARLSPLPSSRSRAPSPAASAPGREVRESPHGALAVAESDPPSYPCRRVRLFSWPLARGLSRSFPAPRPGPRAASAGHSLIHVSPASVSGGHGRVPGLGGDKNIIPWPFALGPGSGNTSPRHNLSGKDTASSSKAGAPEFRMIPSGLRSSAFKAFLAHLVLSFNKKS